MKTGFEDKTLFDWFNLLIVPLILVVGTWFLQNTFKTIENKKLEETRQQELIKSYLKDITDILINSNNNSKGGLTHSPFTEDDKKKYTLKYNDVQNLAGARTLVTLKELNREGREQVMKFLSDADLFDNIPLKRVVLQSDSDQELDLKNLSLTNGNLGDAKIENADLTGAILKGVNLKGATIKATATLTGAEYDDCTAFPNSFNPEDHGMIKTSRTQNEIGVEGPCRYR